MRFIVSWTSGKYPTVEAEFQSLEELTAWCAQLDEEVIIKPPCNMRGRVVCDKPFEIEVYDTYRE